MTVQELIQAADFEVLNIGEDVNREITVPYCCDLLSIAMGKMPPGAAWVTVMGNINTLAVATLADASCIILAEGSTFDKPTSMKAKEQGITVMATNQSIFDAALLIYQKLHA